MEGINDHRQRMAESIEYIRELTESIKTFKEIKGSVFGMSIRGTYLLIARLSLQLNEVDEARKYYFKGAKITTEAFTIFKEGRYPNLKKTGPLPFTSLFAKSFLDAILCGDEKILHEFSQAIYEDIPPTQGIIFYSLLTNAMKELVLGHWEKAKEYANQAHELKHDKPEELGFSHVIKGILDKDLNLINEGIKLRLEHHVREMKNTLIEHVCEEATALVKLALHNGLYPDISSPLIHIGLLEKNENVTSEGVNEILDALAIADRNNSGMLGRLGGFFKD